MIDGVDLMPYIQGKAQDRPHQTLFWSGQYKVVLDGDWKHPAVQRGPEEDLALQPTPPIPPSATNRRGPSPRAPIDTINVS